MKYVTVAEMQAIEQQADKNGLSYEQMMENAGNGLAKVIAELYSGLQPGGVMALVGSGNNGGDALVALARLANQGWKASAYIVRPRTEGDPLVERLSQAGGEIVRAAGDPEFARLQEWIGSHAILLDGVLGTGIKLPLKAEVGQVLDIARQAIEEMEDPPLVVAVDCPSGVDSQTGAAAPETIPADLTVTMAAVKQGLLKFPAYNLIGDLQVVGIGLDRLEKDLPAWESVRHTVPSPAEVWEMLPERPDDAHKGTFGTALVLAGSVNYTGAALLAGKAAYRAGAGLVTMGVPTPLHMSLSGQFVEATWLLLPHELGVLNGPAADLVREKLERVTAILLGPGFGTEHPTQEFVDRFTGGPHRSGRGGMGFIPSVKQTQEKESVKLPPLVVDADGLKLLANIEEWPKRLPAPAVLTPHPGEMAVLTGLSTEEIQADRLGVAERFSREWGHVVVLKGAFTVIAAPDGESAVIPVASAALARAGTGDVLAGLIVGLRAQGLEAYPAAVAGAWIHAQAGLYAAERLGSTAAVLAGDVLESIPEVLADLGY